ncbi:MAG: hypothetical protein IPJ47_22860 [Anaerolineales bacterium]|nr:hypothetical protein [Anaerolineales bacterium]
MPRGSYTAAHDKIHQTAMDEGDENAVRSVLTVLTSRTRRGVSLSETNGRLTIAARKEIPATCAEVSY